MCLNYCRLQALNVGIDHNNILVRLVVFKHRASQFGEFSVLATLKFMRFQAMIVLSSKNFILTYLQKLKSFDLLMTQDSSLRKVGGKTYFRPEMQWTAFRETAT